MDAPSAPPNAVSSRLARSWLNTDRDGEAYWPTATEYLAELRARVGEYERKARRRQRLTFDEARDLRRLLACLADVEAGREGLPTVDQTALEDAGGRLRQALADLAKLEGLEAAPLLAEAGKRLSIAWAGFLALSAKDFEQQAYASIIEHAHHYTAKAKAKARLTPDEVDRLYGALVQPVSRVKLLMGLGVDNGDAAFLAQPEVSHAYRRIERVIPLLASRFGLEAPRFILKLDVGGGSAFWDTFHQRAEEAMKKTEGQQQPGEDTLEQAIRTLFRSVPETWAEYDPAVLNEPREQALCLLVAAGMVERRSSFRLRMFGHPVAVEATLTVTGEYGGVEALERVAAGMWEQWGQAWQARKDGPTKDAPAFHCERIGREQWRLTADGIQARANLEDGEGAVVFDFVLKRGFFDGRPRLMPDGRISQRLPVRGKGAIEKLEMVKADAPGAGPAGVSIANWPEGAKAFADVFAAVFAAIQAKAIVPTMPAPKSAGEHQAEWLAKAMLMVRDHPDWSDAEIARRVDKSPGTLSRSDEYQMAAKLARGSKTDRPKGYVTVDPDSGAADVEAVAPPAAPADDRSDRGKPIPGSRYFREYCAECGEPMKVTPDKVGTKPVCSDCAE